MGRRCCGEGIGRRGGGVGSACINICNSINPYIPPVLFLSEGVDVRKTIVGAGLAISVEKRVTLSVVFVSLRHDVVSMRKSWLIGRCWGLV